MFNESDTHTGCEGCGDFTTTRYTKNIGFYCGYCLVEHRNQEFREAQSYYILSNKISNYLFDAGDRELSNSSIKYFKSKHFKQYLLFDKDEKHYVINRMISAIRIIRWTGISCDEFYTNNDNKITFMLSLLIENRGT